MSRFHKSVDGTGSQGLSLKTLKKFKQMDNYWKRPSTIKKQIDFAKSSYGQAYYKRLLGR